MPNFSRSFPVVFSLLSGCGSFGAAVVVEGADPDGDEPSSNVGSCAAWSEAEHEFVAQGGAVAGTREACSTTVHAMAGAAGSVVAIALDDWAASGEALARLTVVDLLGEPMIGPVVLEAGAELDVPLTRSGEVLIRVESTVPEVDADYELLVECQSGCDLEYTRYPIVLMHGSAPADLVLMDYFFGVREAIESTGYLVIAPEVEPWRPAEERAPQAWDVIRAAQASGLGRRFNLIGHSQGGLDARYIASVLDDDHAVVSVTTVATPHGGAPMADLVSGAVDLSPFDGALIDAAASALLFVIGGEAQHASACLESMTTEYSAQFNDTVVDREDVYYASWAGQSCGMLDFSCQDDLDGEVIASYLSPTFEITALMAGANDGLVPVDSSIWGDYLGVVPADHFDQVGQIAGMTDGTYDHEAFFVGEARRLAASGL